MSSIRQGSITTLTTHYIPQYFCDMHEYFILQVLLEKLTTMCQQYTQHEYIPESTASLLVHLGPRCYTINCHEEVLPGLDHPEEDLTTHSRTKFNQMTSGTSSGNKREWNALCPTRFGRNYVRLTNQHRLLWSTWQPTRVEKNHDKKKSYFFKF